MNNYSMIILAGGKSSRMGRDKSELLLDGKTFLELQIEKGNSLGITDILVSGYRGERCGGAVIVRDRMQNRGPLGGLETCLRAAKNSRCLVLSVDVPLVPVEELRHLLFFEALEGREEQKSSDGLTETLPQKKVTILKNNGKEQPLIGVYHTCLADVMAEELEKTNGSVFAFLKKTGYQVYESEEEAFLFENVNDQKTYERLENITSAVQCTDSLRQEYSQADIK